MPANTSGVASSDVLLVGSVPFETVDEVFETCGTTFGDHLFAMPDGEVGELRSMWVAALPPLVYMHHPDLQPLNIVPADKVKSPDGHGDDFLSSTMSTFTFKPDVSETVFDLYIGPDAIASYDSFRRKREEGVIAEGVRFQVDIPFTLDAVAPFFPRPEDFPIAAKAYETGVQRSISMILDHIPADDLVIQLDYSAELVYMIGALDTFLPQPSPEPPDERFRRLTSREFLAPLSELVPEEVLLGYHLCFGTWGGWPFGRVDDFDPVVRLANALVVNTPHRVDYFHIAPMPDASDAFYAPLADLQIGNAKIFMGIELGDGVDALLHRAAQTRTYLPEFGLAHYCGYGRDKRDLLPQLLEDLRTGAELMAGAKR